MTDWTPEEVAIHNALLSLFCWVDPQNDKPTWPGETRIFINARETVEHCIRAAVAVETKRCAEMAEKPRLSMPLSGETLEETVGFVQRCIAAAIRKEPDAS